MTERLNKIVDIIPKVDTLADVGCDHGYIGLGALKNNKANRVIFVDISRPSLQKAMENCPKDRAQNCKFICQDGLNDVYCDCAVIAGMGGLETISILQKAKFLPQQLVLQPMKNQVDLRKYLLGNYDIVYDFKFLDGKFYDLIYAQKSENPVPLTELELYFGKTNFSNVTSDFAQFLDVEKQKYTQILTQCDDAEVKAKLDLVNLALSML